MKAIALPLLFMFPAVAQAEPSEKAVKLACISDHEQAQIQERKGRLLSARSTFASCAREACPDVVRDACMTALAALGAKVPSVLLRIREASGEGVTDAEVRVDGGPPPDNLSDPIELDPGEHVFVAMLPGNRTARARVSLAPTQRSVPVVLTFDAPEAAAAEESRPVPVSSIVLGGVAAVGLASFVGFGLAGKSTQSCQPSCSRDEVDTMRRQYLFADIGLVTFAAASGAAVYLYVTREPRTPDGDTGRNSVGIGGRF